jgi:hypothetical protein
MSGSVYIAPRPATLDGCWASWEEQQQPAVVRSDMDAGGIVKVRRRYTGIARKASVSVALKAEQYDAFLTWFNADCLQGVYPTRVVTPYKKTEVWRFSGPPKITWEDPKVFSVQVELEQLPAWRGLT